MKNYYITHIAEITRIAKEHHTDWGVAVSMYDNLYGVPERCEEQRRAFSEFVRGKAFNDDGSFRGFVWKDGSVRDEPENARE